MEIALRHSLLGTRWSITVLSCQSFNITLKPDHGYAYILVLGGKIIANGLEVTFTNSRAICSSRIFISLNWISVIKM